MMKLKIWPYGPSNSARNLSVSISELAPKSQCKVLLPKGRSKFVPNPSGVVIINWGNASWTGFPTKQFSGLVFNDPKEVAWAANKELFFRFASKRDSFGLLVPYFTDPSSANIALRKGASIVVRHTVRGHSGEGIEVVSSGEVPKAPLYTRYIPKKAEYRVHFFKQNDGMQFFVQEKKRRLDVPDDQINWQVRNHQNGFIYAIQSAKPIKEMELVESFIETVLDKLTFGAVDIIIGSKKSQQFHNRPVVLEVNTACGLQSPTLLSWYANNFVKRAS